MAILLTRHGETDLNTRRVVQLPDTPLSGRGRVQAERLGESLKHRSIALVITSDYARARMTAERVASHAAVPIVENLCLRERNFGDIRGKPYDELGVLDIFASGYVPPGGESWETFHARVDEAWEAILSHARNQAGDLVVVTHGLVVGSLLERRLGVDGFFIEPRMVVANTAVTTVEAHPPWRVLELASVAHLDDSGRSVAPA